jgi:hypothetical protein
MCPHDDEACTLGDPATPNSTRTQWSPYFASSCKISINALAGTSRPERKAIVFTDRPHKYRFMQARGADALPKFKIALHKRGGASAAFVPDASPNSWAIKNVLHPQFFAGSSNG